MVEGPETVEDSEPVHEPEYAVSLYTKVQRLEERVTELEEVLRMMLGMTT